LISLREKKSIDQREVLNPKYQRRIDAKEWFGREPLGRKGAHR
jgi:hypothetical protein